MLTHGSKQQRKTVKRTPRKQLEPVFKALDTLRNTKWRINRRILSVVDRLWANRGRLADLVDREDSSVFHSQPKSIVGTPAYIEPEVLSRKQYDGKTIEILFSKRIFLDMKVHTLAFCSVFWIL